MAAPSPAGRLDLKEAFNCLGLKDQYESIYEKFGIDDDNPNIWELVVPQGLTCSKILTALIIAGLEIDIPCLRKELHKRHSLSIYNFYGEIDKIVTYNARDPNLGTYRISFEKRVEVAPIPSYVTINNGLSGITIVERLLLELSYFLANGRNLDINYATACIASQIRSGEVPYVRWAPKLDELYINSCEYDYILSRLATRPVLSCQQIII